MALGASAAAPSALVAVTDSRAAAAMSPTLALIRVLATTGLPARVADAAGAGASTATSVAVLTACSSAPCAFSAVLIAFSRSRLGSPKSICSTSARTSSGSGIEASLCLAS